MQTNYWHNARLLFWLQVLSWLALLALLPHWQPKPPANLLPTLQALQQQYRHFSKPGTPQEPPSLCNLAQLTPLLPKTAPQLQQFKLGHRQLFFAANANYQQWRNWLNALTQLACQPALLNFKLHSTTDQRLFGQVVIHYQRTSDA